jgi:hypothetical protein
MDPIILIISLFCLIALLKPFTFPGDATFDDASSTIVLVLAILAYFYGIDLLPANGPVSVLHIFTIGLVNAMAMIDLFVATVLGMPLSLYLIFVVIVPAMLLFNFARLVLKYVAVFSDRTSYFIALVISFISLVMAVRGDFNLLQLLFGGIMTLVAYFAGQASLFATTISFFIACLIIVMVGVVFESMTTLFVAAIIGNPES